MDKHSPNSSRQAAAIALGKLLALATSFITPMILTRYLSKEDFGVYNQFFVIISFSMAFFCFGIQSNLYFFYPQAKRLKRQSIVFHTILILTLFGIIGVGIINIPFISKLFVGTTALTEFKGLINACIIIMVPLNIIEPLFVVRNDLRTSIFYPIINSVLRTGLILFFLFTFSSLRSVFFGILCTAIISSLFALYYSFKDIRQSIFSREIFNLKILKQQMKYSIPFGIGVGLSLLLQRFDKIMCISHLTADDFATYSIAFFGIPGLIQIYQSMSQVALVRMTEKQGFGERVQMLSIYKVFVAKTFSFSIPLILIVGLFAEQLISFLFTKEYLSSVPFFRVYLASFLFTMLGSGLVLRATGNTKEIRNAYIYSSIFSLPLTYLLIKTFGIWGALFGAIVGIILPKLFMIYSEIKILNSKLFDYYPWRKILIIISLSLISIIPLIFMELFFDLSFFNAGVLGGIYLLIVFVLELKSGLFAFQNIAAKWLQKAGAILKRTFPTF